MQEQLTKTEKRCINALKKSEKPLTHAQLLKATWSIDFHPCSNRLQVLIHRLKAKYFEIITHRGVGYSMPHSQRARL